MNRPYYPFGSQRVPVLQGAFTADSLPVLVGQNNCFVACEYLSPHGKANLKQRGRYVDAKALTERGELLAWRYNEAFKEGPQSDEDDKTQPPSKRRKEEHRARLGKKPKKHFDATAVAAAKKALTDVEAAEERAHPKIKFYVCIPAKASLYTTQLNSMH